MKEVRSCLFSIDRLREIAILFSLTLFIVNCGGGEGGGNNGPGDTSGCLSAKDYKNPSYELQKTCLYISQDGVRGPDMEGFVAAIAYADFNGDGYEDVFMSAGDGSENPYPVEMYVNDGFDTSFSLSNNLFVNGVPGSIHPRKALIGDFNNDGVPDIFLIGHGYDKPPWPGEHPLLILSAQDGFQNMPGFEGYVGFQHGGASADIDGDNDLDIFVVDTDQPFFLINDGTGNLTYETVKVPDDLHNAIYTAELIDIDMDGFYDLFVAGHEYDGMETTIYWGSDTYTYTSSDKTIIPSVPGQGTVVDLDAEDIDDDGSRDLVLTRTGGGQDNFYVGFYIQVLINEGARSFTDETDLRMPTGQGFDNWIIWLRLQDFDQDGDIDIIVDDAERDLIWFNDGNGYF